jgi:Flp pilus assembly protein CpaB
MQQTAPPRKPRGSRLAPRRVLATRQGTIISALVTAVLAAAIMVVFLDGYRDSTRGDGNVSALVAKGLIERGTSGEVIATEELFTRESVAEDQLREGAVSDPAALRGKVSETDILPGQQLTAGAFATSNGAPSSRLSDYERAITVAVDTSHGLLGNVREGDKVDVLGAFNATNGNDLAGSIVRMLVRNVLVLEAPGSGDLDEDRVNEEKAVTLRVTDRQAMAIAFTEERGKVWLLLRPPTRAKQAPISAVSAQRLLAGVRPVETRPGGGIDEDGGGDR